MEYSLQSYFDIGVSYGLSDSAFEHSGEATVPDILGIGIRNPLGLGILHQMDEKSPELTLWRKEAAKKVDAPEMELGYDGPAPAGPKERRLFEDFKSKLRILIETHPIELFEMTIYPIGVAFIRLDFSAGIPIRFVQGLGHCFEFAAYSVDVSEKLLDTGRCVAEGHLKKRPSRLWRRATGMAIQALSKRPEPEIQEDETGYKESRLFSSFTHVAMCVQEGDDDDVDQIKRRVLPLDNTTNEPDSIEIIFEYHGTIHFNWAACVIEPNSYDKPGEPPKKQIRRILLCIQIAHTFLGACTAFEKLFLHETREQAEGFIKGQPGGLTHIELNRLRTLALAVISMTKFTSLTEAEEDQTYFLAFDNHARLADLHQTILMRSQVPLEVQQAESNQEQARRDLSLNAVVLFLTSFALLSVLSDTYNFLKGQEPWLSDVNVRFEILGITIICLLLILTLTFLRLIGGGRAGR